MTPRHVVLLSVLAGGWALLGCSPPDASLSQEQRQALEKAQLGATLMSDQATIVYAQKELALAQAKVNAAPGEASSRAALTRAEAHLKGAQLTMTTDEDRVRLQQDESQWLQFAKSPEMR